MDVNSRKKELEDLDLFVDNKRKILNSVLDSVGWTEESLNNEVKIRCPINPGHWIPEAALLHHKEICEWVQHGYQKEELEKQPPDSTFFYEKLQNIIPVTVDYFTQEKILSECGLLNKDNATSVDIPMTVDRWSVHFNPDQRLAIYDYIVNASKTVEKPKNVTLEDLMIDFEKKEQQDEKPKSQLELLAEMRDYKRRRQSYRAKNVHITKKSYTEVMKEVIENQTNFLVETIKFESSENSMRENKESHDNQRKQNYDTDNYSNSEDSSSKYRDHHSDYKDDYRRHHRSHHKSSRHHSPKRKKHKRDHSRSRSPSHHKRKKSHKRK